MHTPRLQLYPSIILSFLYGPWSIYWEWKKQASAFSTQFLLGEAEYEVKDAKMSFKDVITFYLG